MPGESLEQWEMVLGESGGRLRCGELGVLGVECLRWWCECGVCVVGKCDWTVWCW